MICPSTRSFFDPNFNENGEPYGPERFKQIVKEQYLISKTINTSYLDLEKVTPQERTLLLRYIVEDNEKIMKKMSEKKENK